MIMVGAFTSQTLSYSLWSFRFHELSIGNLPEGNPIMMVGTLTSQTVLYSLWSFRIINRKSARGEPNNNG